MVFANEQVDDLLLVGWIEEPTLRLDAGGKKSDEKFAMLLGPEALREKARGLIGANQLLHGAEASETIVFGYKGNRRAEHGAGEVLVFAHGGEALRRGAEGPDLVVLAGGQAAEGKNLLHLQGVGCVRGVDKERFPV